MANIFPIATSPCPAKSTGQANSTRPQSIPGFEGNILGCQRSVVSGGNHYVSFYIRFVVSDKFLKEKLVDLRNNASSTGFEVTVTEYPNGKLLELSRSSVPINESDKVLKGIQAQGNSIQNEINTFGMELKTETIRK